MTRKTTDQMFGKVARDIAREERERKEMFERIERDQVAADARLDEPLTRREVVEALETTAFEYECSGTEESDRIAAVFRKLAERLS